jgi:hypothetical protein
MWRPIPEVCEAHPTLCGFCKALSKDGVCGFGRQRQKALGFFPTFIRIQH